LDFFSNSFNSNSAGFQAEIFACGLDFFGAAAGAAAAAAAAVFDFFVPPFVIFFL